MDTATENLILEAVEASVSAAYLRLKENGLTEINERLDSLEGRMDGIDDKLVLILHQLGVEDMNARR